MSKGGGVEKAPPSVTFFCRVLTM